MTDEELKNHLTLERAFLRSKDTRNRLKKRVKDMQEIINKQNEAIQRKEHFIGKCLKKIDEMKCCSNCKHWIVKVGFNSKCELDEPCIFGTKDKWECKE